MRVRLSAACRSGLKQLSRQIHKKPQLLLAVAEHGPRKGIECNGM